MAAVSETIVREYFELNGFLVRQFRKCVAPAEREDEEIDFLVLNPHPQERTADRPFVITSPDLGSIERAVIVIKAWHTGVFTPALLDHAPDFFRFLQKRTFNQAAAGFGKGRTLLKILALPALPQETQARDQSIAILRSHGLDGAISFRTMLAHLVCEVEPNRNYQKSDLLQLIRILKNYDFIKDQQLDLFGPNRKRPKTAKPKKEDSPAPDAAPRPSA